MRIQHNIMALNAYRNYNNNIGTLSKNLEKLSSGYRINRAGDDAAGLAISEKMRAQITGLDAAQKNVKDGISLVKTAEGALQEVQDMMNRMKYLATQSANGTYDNEVDRANLQKEVDALKTEINRIADSANFNGQKLLNGELAAETTTQVTDAAMSEQKVLVEGAAVLADVSAQAAKTSYTFAGKLVDGTAAANGGILGIDVELSDGSTITVDVPLIAGDPIDTAIKTALQNNDKLSDLFTISSSGANTATDPVKLMFEAKQTGSGTLTVTGLTFSEKKISDNNGGFGAATAKAVIQVQDAGGTDGAIATTKQSMVTEQAGTDAYKQLDFDNIAGGGSAGDTANASLLGQEVTIGDKTYAFVDGETAYDLEEGKVGVYLGETRNETMQNLVAALKANGVESAEVDGINVKIGDTKELETTLTATNSIETTGLGAEVNFVEAQDAVYTAALTASTASTDEKVLTLSYRDQDGVEKSIKLNYKAAAASKTAAANAMATAINGDENASKLFEVSVDGSDNLLITAKGDVKGMEVTSLSTTDTNVTGVALTNTTEANAAGVKLTLDNDRINSGDTVTINGKTYQFAKAGDVDQLEGDATKVLIGSTKADTVNNLMMAMKADGIEAENLSGNIFLANSEDAATVTTTGGLTLQIGDTADNFNQMNVTVGDMHVEALGIGELDISTLEGAQAAVDTITNAINTVSSTRGDLGAIQNRLEHTTNNLAVMKENIQDAESSIRDTDVADEMMKYTKNNILIQSAQAMLAQANAVPQGVLQLLQ